MQTRSITKKLANLFTKKEEKVNKISPIGNVKIHLKAETKNKTKQNEEKGKFLTITTVTEEAMPIKRTETEIYDGNRVEVPTNRIGRLINIVVNLMTIIVGINTIWEIINKYFDEENDVINVQLRRRP